MSRQSKNFNKLGSSDLQKIGSLSNNSKRKKQESDDILNKSPQNDQMKSLNKARQENLGKDLKSFEVMDSIYQRVRNKTNDSLIKVDGLLHSQARQLYYEKKADIYQLLKDQKRQDELSLQKYLDKTNKEKNGGLGAMNWRDIQELKLRKICQEFNIDVKSMRLPYKEKIRQICNNFHAFYRYKKDQRDVLDQSLLRNKEYLEQCLQNEEYLRVLMRVQYIGENSLNEKEQAIYEKLKEIRRMNQSLDKRQEFYLQQLEKKRKIIEEQDKQPTPSQNQSVSLGTASSAGRSNKLIQNKNLAQQMQSQSQSMETDEGLVIQEDNDEQSSVNLMDINVADLKLEQGKNKRNLQFFSQDCKPLSTMKKSFYNSSSQPQSPHLPSIRNFQINPKPIKINASLNLNGFNHQQKLKQPYQQLLLHQGDKTFISQMKINSGDFSARTSDQNMQSTERQTNYKTTSRLDNLTNRSGINYQRNAMKQCVQSEQNSPRLPGNMQLINRGYLKNKLVPLSTAQLLTNYLSTNNQQKCHKTKKTDYQKLKDSIEKNPMPKQMNDFLLKKREILQKIDFKQKTPKLNDEDIRHLIKLYPPSRLEHEKLEEVEAEKIKLWQKKTLDKILRNIDQVETQNKTDQDKIVFDMLVQSIRDDEFLRTLDKLKEIDFAESVVLQTLFEYKLKDEHDQQDLANEVAKEYHSGKLDPLLALRIERKNKTKQNQLKKNGKTQQQKDL
eukprot:403334032